MFVNCQVLINHQLNTTQLFINTRCRSVAGFKKYLKKRFLASDSSCNLSFIQTDSQLIVTIVKAGFYFSTHIYNIKDGFLLTYNQR